MNPDRTTERAASAEDVFATLRDSCKTLGTERVSLEDALGRVLREPVHAAEDQPAFDRSAVDGFAVRFDDPGPQYTVIDTIRAGDWRPRTLHLGETVRVATGAALPASDLRVVMKEAVTVHNGRMVVNQRDPDRHIRFAGEDASRGQQLIEPGTLLQAGTLGLMASVGCIQPLVTRQPRVLHVATGNEIVPPDQAPGSGQIRDSNSTLVRAFLQSWGLRPAQLRLAEDESVVRRAVADRLDTVDLLLISGGASVGEHDFTRHLLADLGFEVKVRRTTARPGKPLIVAQHGSVIAFGLPGNPLAHFVCLNLYVRCALRHLLGLPIQATFHQGVLTHTLPARPNANEIFWPAVAACDHGECRLTPLPWRSSGDLTPLAAANALIRVLAQAGEIPAGARAQFTPTTSPP